MRSIGAEKERFVEFRDAIIQHKLSRAREREAQAMEKVRLAASVLKQKYGCRNVFLYGSLARGGFSSRSDIDLLIEGFKGRYWEMYRCIEDVASPFEISIICAENAQPALREEVEKYGVGL